MVIHLLGQQLLLLGKKEYVANRPKSQLSNAASAILMLKLRKLVNGTEGISREILVEPVKGLCRKLREKNLVPDNYRPRDLICDLEAARIDAFDFALAIQNLDLQTIACYNFHQEGDFLKNVSRNFHENSKSVLVDLFRTLLEQMIGHTSGARFMVFHELLDSIRRSIRSNDPVNSMTQVETETEEILKLEPTERDIALRALWTRTFNTNHFTDLRRSLDICEPILGNSVAFSVAMANYNLGIGELDIADLYIEDAQSRFEGSGASETAQIALVHLNARVSLRKFEQCHSFIEQHEILDRVTKMAEAFPNSVHLNLLVANTLTRRAFYTKDFDPNGTQAPKEEDVRDWSDKADRIYKKLCRPIEENTERNKALVARCYLHAMSQALDYGSPNGDTSDLLPPVLKLLNESGKDDPYAYSVAVYCYLVRRQFEMARTILNKATITNLSQRRDKGAIFFAVLGYMCMEIGSPIWDFCRIVLVEILSKRNSSRMEENFEPIFRSCQVPTSTAFFRDLVRALRWELGFDPLRKYRMEFRQLIEGEPFYRTKA